MTLNNMNDDQAPTISAEASSAEANGFSQFHLDPLILKALDKMGFKDPSPIQMQTLPLIQQKKDLIALAQTGSGKTAACAIPICHAIDTTQKDIQALIIVPTRELALQYATEAQKIGNLKGVKTFAIFGGEDAQIQQSKLRHGVHVLVATPGRLIDFIYARQINLSSVKTLVLDEADEMLSMGFYEDLEFIIQCLIQSHQTLLFSATMPNSIKQLARQHMKEPVEINLTVKEKSPENIDHQFVYCHPDRRNQELIQLLKTMEPVQSIIFCQSRLQVEHVCRALRQQLQEVDFLHAGLSQDIRNIVTSKFRSGKIRFLVATDVVARGLDFSRISHVFIYELAADPAIYVHRSGRTGRYDKTGSVISLVTNRELSILRYILKHIKREPKWIGSPPPLKKPPAKRPINKRSDSSK